MVCWGIISPNFLEFSTTPPNQGENIMNLYETFETDDSFESDGIWVKYPGQKIKIAFAGNRNSEYEKALTDAFTKMGKSHNEALTEDEARDIFYEVYAKAVVRDMEVKQEDGSYKKGILLKTDKGFEVKPFNKNNVIQLFKDLPHFYDDIKRFSSDWTNYRKEVEKEQVKK
jgi:hypothetical protein